MKANLSLDYSENVKQKEMNLFFSSDGAAGLAYCLTIDTTVWRTPPALMGTTHLGPPTPAIVLPCRAGL